MMRTIIAVGLGGFAGSVLRYGVSRAMANVPGGGLPLGTLVVNILGCLLLGLLTGIFDRHGSLSPDARLFFTTGLCGGFTTFSTFMGENFAMARGGQFPLLLAYLAISLIAGFALFFAGYAISTKAIFSD